MDAVPEVEDVPRRRTEGVERRACSDANGVRRSEKRNRIEIALQCDASR